MLLAQIDPISGGLAGWSSFGIAGLVLAWLFFRHLPAKDQQLTDLMKAHAAALESKDAHVKAIITEHTAQTKAITTDQTMQMKTIADAHAVAMKAKDEGIKTMSENHALVIDRVIQNCQEESRLEREAGETRFRQGMEMLTKIHESTREAVHATRNLGQSLQYRNRLADAVQSAELAMWTKALDGTVTSWNTACERLLGWKQGEIVGRSVLAHIIPPDLRSLEEEVLRKISAGQVVDEYETERMMRNGDRLKLLVVTSPIRDQAGRVIGASTIARERED